MLASFTPLPAAAGPRIRWHVADFDSATHQPSWFAAVTYGGIINRTEQTQLEKRYGSPAPKSRVIDLSAIDLRTALVDIANQLLQEDIGPELREVKFRLSKACVIKTESKFETAAEKTTIKVTAGSERTQTIRLKVRRKDSQYVFG